MPRFSCLFLLLFLAACTAFDAGPPPVPRGAIGPQQVAPQAVMPVDIRPLTEDQRAMLDG